MAFGALTYADQLSIHETSMAILERVGVRVVAPLVLSRLADLGAEVDADGSTVRFTEEVLRRLIDTCPSQVRLGDRDGNARVLGVDGGHAFWPGNALRLVDGGESRVMDSADVQRLTRLVDRLEHVHGMVGVAVSEFEPSVRGFRTLRLMANHTRKHLRPVIISSTGLDAVMEMATVLEDGRPEGSAPVISFGYSILSPLHWTETALSLMEKTSGHGFPFMLNAEPLAGGTSPVTLAGSLAQANAETLSGIAIAQALEPGRPCLYNAGFAHALDMRTTVALCGSPEVYLMAAGSAAMARLYGMPCVSWVSTEAMGEDAQAASEKAMGLLLHVERGIDLIWGMGQLESQMSISAAQLVIDDEIAGQVERLQQGITVDAEHLAADILMDGGHPDMLSHPHTLEWFRSELSEVRVGNRQGRAGWVARGGLDMREQARRRAEEILAAEWEPVLTEEQDRELERIEVAWRAQLGE